MFKIYDGRDAFYQWDLNRKLIVEDKSVKEVHFCNRTSDCSLITEVYELEGLYVADVPNILLQDNWDIKVYAYDSEYTKHCETYDVIARTRPDDYVYTETEQRKWEHLEARIDEIEQNGISEESISNAVSKYLDENGVEVDMTGIATEEYVAAAIAAIEIPDNALLLESYVTNAATGAEVQNIWSNGITKPVYFEKKPVIGYKKENSDSSRKLTLYVLTDNHTITQYSAIFSETANTMTFNSSLVTALATEKYVDDAIANLDIPEADVDLSNYYTKTETETAINNAKPDLSGYALKTEIPDVSEYMGEQDVEDYVAGELKPYATKTYVADSIEDALAEFEPSSGGGSGDAVEEVYVGTEEPTDASYKIWINPEEEGGSVKVDGTTIVKNLDGTISAAIGGGRTLVAEPVVMYEYELGSNSLGFTQYSSSNKRFASMSHDFLSLLDKSVKYTVELGFHNASTNENGTCVGYITYDVSNTTMPWAAEGLSVFDCEITALGYSTAQGVFLNGKTSKYSTYYINAFKVSTPAEYEYNQIDGNYVKVGSGFKVNGDNELETTLGGLDMVNGLDLIMTVGENTDNSLKYHNVALGSSNTIGYNSQAGVALGANNEVSPASGYGYVAIGRQNSVTGGYGGAAIGYRCRAQEMKAIAVGCGASAVSAEQVALGKWNVADGNYTVVIGNGTSDSARANGLTINSAGNIVTQGTVSNGGADYAEYFEWLDGNPEDEDRIGYIVALEGNKIRLAQAGDDILGVVSGTATVLGDDAEWHWHGKYLRDDFGRVQTKVIQLYGEDGKPEGYATVPVVNPEFDETQYYIPRSERCAWDVIGLMGKLYVRDDGSCRVGGYATVAADGLASFSAGRTNMRVMERISDSIVRVLLK